MQSSSLLLVTVALNLALASLLATASSDAFSVSFDTSGDVNAFEALLAVNLTVTRSGNLSEPFSAWVEFADVNATGGVDYDATPVQVDFGALEASRVVTVPLVDDSDVEDLESFTARIVNVTGASGSVAEPSEVAVVIAASDSFVVEFASSTFSVDESSGPIVLSLVRSEGVGAFAVDVSFALGTAGASDFTSSKQTVHFSSSQDSATLNVAVNNDNEAEFAEMFTASLGDLSVSSGSGSIGALSTAEVTIEASDLFSIELSTSSYTVGEGAGQVNIQIDRVPGGITGECDVTIVAAGITAVGGSDFDASTQVVTLSSSSSSVSVTVPVLEDTLSENDESFVVSIAALSSQLAVFGDQRNATITIPKNDPFAVRYTTSTTSVAESGGSVVITIVRTVAIQGSCDINVTFADGTATGGGVDYDSTPQTVHIAEGESATTVTVPITSDALTEGTETFDVILDAISDPTGQATIATPSTVTVSIVEATSPFTVEFSDAAFAVQEGDGTATVTVSRAGETGTSFTVDVIVTEGNATSVGDFDPSMITLNFANGETSDTVDIPIVDDAIAEGAETFRVSLANIVGGAGEGSITGQATADVVIAPSDAFTVAFSSASYSANEEDGSANVTVSRVPAAGAEGAFTVVLTPSVGVGGNASAAVDFSADPITVSFGAQDASVEVRVPVVADSVDEGVETFAATLGSLSDPSGQGSIGAPASAEIYLFDSSGSSAATASNATGSAATSPAAGIAANASLASLVASDGTLEPAFRSEVVAYDLSVTSTVSTLSFTAVCAAECNISVSSDLGFSASVDSDVASTPVPLSAAGTTTTITITSVAALNASVSTDYAVSVYRSSDDARLSALRHDREAYADASLSPGFSPATTAYTLAVPTAVVGNVSILATRGACAQANCTSVTVSPATVTSVPGTATVTVVPEDSSAASTVYTVSVIAQSLDRTLAALDVRRASDLSSIAAAAMSPSPFAAGTLAYTVSVDSATAALDIVATCGSAVCASYTVSVASPAHKVQRSSGASTGAVALGPAGTTTTISIDVTPQDTYAPAVPSSAYTIVVSRAAVLSQDARLAALEDSYALHGAAHDPDTTAYPAVHVLPSHTNTTVSLTSAVCAASGCAVTFSATEAGAGGAVLVPPGAALGTAVPLRPGVAVTLVVTSVPQNTTATAAVYTLSYMRPAIPPSTDARLSFLGDAFGVPIEHSGAGTARSEITVSSAVTNISTAGVLCAQANCTGWTVFASGNITEAQAAAALPTSVVYAPDAVTGVIALGRAGETTVVTIVGIAEDGITVSLYRVAIRRLGANAALSGLSTSLGVPAASDFDPGALDYAGTVPAGVSVVTFTVSCADSACSGVTVDGAAASRDVGAPGATFTSASSVADSDASTRLPRTVTVTVSAEDPAAPTTTYRVFLARAPVAGQGGQTVPVILSVKPRSGTASGGSKVTILGAGFGSDPEAILAVSLAGVKCADAVLVTDAEILCTSAAVPASGTPPAGFTVVETRAGTASSASAWSYTAARPVIVSVRPRVISADGGTLITVRGENFVPQRGVSDTASVAVEISGGACTSPRFAVSETGAYEIVCAAPSQESIALSGTGTGTSAREGGGGGSTGSLDVIVAVDGVESLPTRIEGVNGAIASALRFGIECIPACGWNEHCSGGVCSGCLPGWTNRPACDVPSLSRTPFSQRYTSEDGEAVTTAVSLAHAPGPVDLVVRVGVNIEDEAAVVSGEALTFTSTDWSSPREVTVTGREDDRRDGNTTFQVSFEIVSGDSFFTGADPASRLAPAKLVNLDSAPALHGLEPAVTPFGGRNVTLRSSKLDRHVQVYIADTGAAARILDRRASSTPASTSSPSSSSSSSSRSSALSRAELDTARGIVLPESDTVEEVLSIELPRHTTLGYVDLVVVNAGDRNGSSVMRETLYYTDKCPEPGQLARDDGTCVECPTGGECPGGDRIWPKPGYWNSGENSGFVELCDPPAACEGGKQSTCRAGHTGTFCTECLDGFYDQAGLCTACPDQGSVISFIIADAVLWMLVALSCALMPSHSLGIMVGAVRMIQTFSVLGSMRAPGGAGWAQSYWDAAGLLSGQYTVLKPDCLQPVPYEQVFAWSIGYNAVLFVPAWICWAAARSISVRRHDTALIRAYWSDRGCRIAILHFLVMYLPVTANAFGAVSCMPTGVGTVLAADPSVVCFRGSHVPVFIAGVILILGVTVATPLALAFLLRRQVRKLAGMTPLHRSPLHERYGALFELFAERHYQGWLGEVALSVVIAVCLSFLRGHQIARLVVLGAAFLARIAIVAWLRPMGDLMSNVQEVCVAAVAVVLVVHNYLVHEDVVEAQSTTSDVLAASVVATSALCVLLAAVTFAMSLRRGPGSYAVTKIPGGGKRGRLPSDESRARSDSGASSASSAASSDKDAVMMAKAQDILGKAIDEHGSTASFAPTSSTNDSALAKSGLHRSLGGAFGTPPALVNGKIFDDDDDDNGSGDDDDESSSASAEHLRRKKSNEVVDVEHDEGSKDEDGSVSGFLISISRRASNAIMSVFAAPTDDDADGDNDGDDNDGDDNDGGGDDDGGGDNDDRDKDDKDNCDRDNGDRQVPPSKGGEGIGTETHSLDADTGTPRGARATRERSVVAAAVSSSGTASRAGSAGDAAKARLRRSDISSTSSLLSAGERSAPMSPSGVMPMGLDAGSAGGRRRRRRRK